MDGTIEAKGSKVGEGGREVTGSQVVQGIVSTTRTYSVCKQRGPNEGLCQCHEVTND